MKAQPILILPASFAAIDFASPMMLGWLAAATLPWLINLWSRRRHVETPWAAVDLLMAAIRERSRRLRLRELLLLALRTAILVLVALAAAGPYWRRAASPGAVAARTHHVLVMDQSFSMGTTVDGDSRFSRAKARARQIIDDAPAGDAFTVVGWSETADNVLGRPTFDAASALAAVDSIELLDTVADLPAAVRAVDAAMKAAKEEFPGLAHARPLFISDMGVDTWSPAIQLQAQAESNSVLPPGAIVESVDEGARENVAITDISMDPPLAVLDRPLTVTVDSKSFGADPTPRLDVQLLLDGARVGQQTVSLESGGQVTARFETRLVEAGNHVFEARLGEEIDSLSIDNRRWLSVEATRGPRALLVADVASAAEDIARALNPRYRDGGGEDGIGVEVIATAGLAAAELTAYDAVFLCNIAALSDREQRLLQRYVAGGGAMVVVLGDRIRPASFNELFALKSAGGEGVLNLKVADQPATGDWRLDPLEYRHAILEPFAGRSRSGLLGVRVSQYFPLSITDEGDTAVAMAFTSGDPALIVGTRGLGGVAVFATDPALTTRTTPWSTLAVSPSFVPLMRELFFYLTADRRVERLNRLAGEPLMPGGDAAGESQSGARWKDPLGNITATPPASDRSGIYTVERDGAAATVIAVNVDPVESDLTAIDVGDLQKQGVVEQAVTATSGADFAGAIPLQGYLLAAAAVLMLVELTVAWLFGRGWA